MVWHIEDLLLVQLLVHPVNNSWNVLSMFAMLMYAIPHVHLVALPVPTMNVMKVADLTNKTSNQPPVHHTAVPANRTVVRCTTAPANRMRAPCITALQSILQGDILHSETYNPYQPTTGTEEPSNTNMNHQSIVSLTFHLQSHFNKSTLQKYNLFPSCTNFPSSWFCPLAAVEFAGPTKGSWMAGYVLVETL